MDKIVSYIIGDLGENFSKIRLNNCTLDVKKRKLDFKFILPKGDFDTYYNEDTKYRYST